MSSLVLNSILHGRDYTYCIEKVLGQGAFGITYLATTKVKVGGALGAIDITIRVAVKEFFMRDINGREGETVTTGSKGGVYDDYKKKFLREATNLSHIKHLGIVKVLECFEANNTVYYSMEYLEGGSLDSLIEKCGGLKEDESIAYIRKIGDALGYMHSRKMLHLDLKPLNIMLRDRTTPVLIDFGLSKQYDSNGQPESSTNVGSGTPGYAPIEQANYREGSDFPETMDVYALGATLFKMLSGVRPPDSSAILNDGFPIFLLQQRGVSEDTISAVANAMQPMKKTRPQSVADFLNLLNGCTTTDETTAIDEPIAAMELDESIKQIVSSVSVANSHEWIDLGLSVKWATCNVGANSPEESGNYFAWGETTTKSEYAEENCKTYRENIGDISGDPTYDAARANWGGSWRMPTKAEWHELIDKCTWQWTTQGGKNGYKVTGQNGNCIFLPAGGWRGGMILTCSGILGYYWSSSPNDNSTQSAHGFDQRGASRSCGLYCRHYGLSIRPVTK